MSMSMFRAFAIVSARKARKANDLRCYLVSRALFRLVMRWRKCVSRDKKTAFLLRRRADRAFNYLCKRGYS